MVVSGCKMDDFEDTHIVRGYGVKILKGVNKVKC